MTRTPVLALAVVVCSGLLVGALAAEDSPLQLVSRNDAGQLRSVALNGLDLNNPFFQDLGTNGRRCSTCHLPDQAWTITPEGVQERFAETRGLDPIFRTNDGSNCEGVGGSTPAQRRNAYSLLLSRGLIRIGIDVPATAEFAIVAVDDPYHCGAPLTQASMYRRPLPSTNVKFLSAVMWDGRESPAGTLVIDNLQQQSNDATQGHAQGQPISASFRQQIVDFELGLFTAQVRDNRAESLHAQGATGGQMALSHQPFFIGINDPVGFDPAGFNPEAFTIFSAWSSITGHSDVEDARRSIARGERIFNTKTFTISGVAGLNDSINTPGGPVTLGDGLTTFGCTVCHDSPNAGNHSVKAPLNIGLTDASRRTADMPLYTLRKIAGGDEVKTTDPGRAMITGKWADIGKFKGPILRGLAGRAPYFHNGLAKSLVEVVDFYDSRFNINFTPREKKDLVAFLRAL